MNEALTQRRATLPGPGDEIDRYEVVGEIAQGGMAAVYLVRRHDTGGFDRLLAMKVMLPHLAGEPRFVDMFVDEARIASFVHHPNVVQVFDVGTTRDGLPFMVMEYLRGRSLVGLLQRTWLSEPRTLTPAMLYGIFSSVASGLHAAHVATDREGAPLEIVHRDVSPQNVHVSYDGVVRVVDFGIAAARGRITSTRSGEVKGKVSYLAPEQVNGARATWATDLWALGVIAYETLSGRRLFRGESDGETLFNIINREVPRLETFAPEVPAAVCECIHRCLDRRTFRRPSSAAEVARVFEQAAAAGGGLGVGPLRDVVQAAFAAERSVEDERIAATLRSAPARLREDTREIAAPSHASAPDGAGRGLRWPLVAVAVGLAAVGVGAGWWLQRSTASPAPAEAPVAAEAAPREVRVDVGAGVASVLVDGVADARRPLRVALGEGGERSVVLVDTAGRAHARTLTEADDGATLTLPEVSPREVAAPEVAAPEVVSGSAEPTEEVEPQRRTTRRARRRRRAPREEPTQVRPLASPYEDP
ncbi:MAG: serine/threonine-protein kinase [Myxococcota bacterium]|nr:serine/threonine-protein kinase [Myxococcota bacterium]